MHLPVINCMVESVTLNKKGEIFVNVIGMGFNWNLKVLDEVDVTSIEVKKLGHAIIDFENKIEPQHINWLEEDKNTKEKKPREATFVNHSLVPGGFVSFTSDQKVCSDLYQVLSKFPVLKHHSNSSNSHASSVPSDKK